MFFKFLVEKRCSNCGKLDRSVAFTTTIKDSREDRCLFSSPIGFYYVTAYWLRIMQSIALTAIFIILSSALIIVRSSDSLNLDTNTIIKSYQLSLNSVKYKNPIDKFLEVKFVSLSE